MPPLPDSASAAAPQASTPGNCRACGEHLGANDLFCEGCGLDLSAPPPAAEPAPTGPAADGSVPGPAGGSAPGPAAGGAAAEGAGPDTGTDTGKAAALVWPPAPDAAGTDSFHLPPPLVAAPEGGSGDTLVLGVAARLSDPREEPAARESGPVCVACGVGGVDEDGYCEHCGHAQPRQRDHQEQELEGVAAVSDRGLRHHRNEDAFTVAAASLPDGTPAVAAVVCDGVSTSYRPDDASAAASAAGSESLLAALERGRARRTR